MQPNGTWDVPRDGRVTYSTWLSRGPANSKPSTLGWHQPNVMPSLCMPVISPIHWRIVSIRRTGSNNPQLFNPTAIEEHSMIFLALTKPTFSNWSVQDIFKSNASQQQHMFMQKTKQNFCSVRKYKTSGWRVIISWQSADESDLAIAGRLRLCVQFQSLTKNRSMIFFSNVWSSRIFVRI